MTSTTITLLDRAPIVGRRGQSLVTEPRPLPAGFCARDWFVASEGPLGRDALRIALQDASDPTVWRGVDDLDVRAGLRRYGAVDLCGSRFVRIRIDFLDDAPCATWSGNSQARLLLTVRLRGIGE